MKPVIQKVSFYPYSYHDLPKKGYYAIIRYNIVKHKWIEISRRFGLESEVEQEVYELNEEAGIITEMFITNYKE